MNSHAQPSQSCGGSLRTRARSILALGCLLVSTAVAARADDLPFSQILTPAERSEAGLNKLSGEQIAILDALVAREELSRMNAWNSVHPQAADFSHGLAPDKRHSAGLDRLTAPELVRLDDLVQKNLSLKMAESAPAVGPLKPEGIKPRPQVHGELGVMVAVGSHGYNAYGGYVALNYADLAKRYSISAFYAETRVKGVSPDSACPEENHDRKRSYLERDAGVTFSFGHGPLW
ncbi:MAG TPA: hypothetical protein VMI53_03175 [Opitutaceae bacterium]|nr:hypothetical protein [Opitutaceae bacterium]